MIPCPCPPRAGRLFFCDRHACHKTPFLRERCLERGDFWEAWEAGRGPGQADPDPKRAKIRAEIRRQQEADAEAAGEALGLQPADVRNYVRALGRWQKAGRPTRSAERIAHLFETFCRDCKHYSREKPAAAGPLTALLVELGRRLAKILTGQPAGQCVKCGCGVSRAPLAVLNKLAMATEPCPAKKFPADVCHRCKEAVSQGSTRGPRNSGERSAPADGPGAVTHDATRPRPTR